MPAKDLDALEAQRHRLDEEIEHAEGRTRFPREFSLILGALVVGALLDVGAETYSKRKAAARALPSGTAAGAAGTTFVVRRVSDGAIVYTGRDRAVAMAYASAGSW